MCEDDDDDQWGWNEYKQYRNHRQTFHCIAPQHDPAGWVIIYCRQLSSSSYLCFIFLHWEMFGVGYTAGIVYAIIRRSFNIWGGWCWLYLAWYNYSWFEELTIAFILLQLTGASSFVSVLGSLAYNVQITRTPSLAVYCWVGLGFSTNIHTYGYFAAS